MRRREQVDIRADRAAPPPWVVRILPALAEYHRRGGRTRPGETIPEGFTAWWRSVRDDWCRDNGCHRVGKTCEKAGQRTCGAGHEQTSTAATPPRSDSEE